MPKLVYVAHPYGGDPANLLRAKRWLKALSDAFPDVAFIAPWITNCEIFDEAPENIERGLRDDYEIVSRCDAFLMVGGKISTGMARERIAAENAYDQCSINDWTHFATEPGLTGMLEPGHAGALYISGCVFYPKVSSE